jgi:hypothetical protein
LTNELKLTAVAKVAGEELYKVGPINATLDVIFETGAAAQSFG